MDIDIVVLSVLSPSCFVILNLQRRILYIAKEVKVMYELTKTTSVMEQKNQKRKNADILKKKVSFKYFLKTVSVFLIYFLLSKDCSFFNCLICVFLIFTGLIDTVDVRD